MPAVVIDIGHHFVEPNAADQTVELTVASTKSTDPQVGAIILKAQIAAGGPVFEDVDFSTDLWTTFPHAENGGPQSGDPHVATGAVTFKQDFEAVADGQVVKLRVDATGIPSGSYELRLAGTRQGGTELYRADGTQVPAVIINGTIQVRSIWQNPTDVNDVDGDGFISPRDVLLVVNRINKQGPEKLPLPSHGNEPPPYYDVDGDGYTSANDALTLINCLNGGRCKSTPTAIAAQPTPPSNPDDTTSTTDRKPGDEQPPEQGDSEPPITDPPPGDPDDPVDENEKNLPPDPIELVFANTPLDELVDLGLAPKLFSKS